MNSNRSFAFIPARFTHFAFAFYMSAIMAFLMTIILVLINTGYDSAFWIRAFQSYIIAWPIAFFCVIFVRPLVMRLLSLTVKS